MTMTECHRGTSKEIPREPSLGEALNEPAVKAMMRADRVNPDELARILAIVVRDRSFRGAHRLTEIRLPVSEPRQPLTPDEELPE